MDSYGSLTMTKNVSGKYYGNNIAYTGQGGARLGMVLDASKSSKVYSNSATTITPDYVKMYVYFYVGPKTTNGN